MLKKSPKFKNFVRLVNSYSKLEGPLRLTKIKDIIINQYLDDAEKNYYSALLLNMEGRKQQDLCLAFSTFQPYFNKRIKRVVNKMRIIGEFLTSEDLKKQFYTVKEILPKKKFKIFHLFLLGYNQKRVAKQIKVSSPYINYIYKEFDILFNTKQYKTLRNFFKFYKYYFT